MGIPYSFFKAPTMEELIELFPKYEAEIREFKMCDKQGRIRILEHQIAKYKNKTDHEEDLEEKANMTKTLHQIEKEIETLKSSLN